jgi:hypothetical protein
MMGTHANSLQYISEFNLCLDVKTNITSGKRSEKPIMFQMLNHFKKVLVMLFFLNLI